MPQPFWVSATLEIRVQVLPLSVLRYTGKTGVPVVDCSNVASRVPSDDPLCCSRIARGYSEPGAGALDGGVYMVCEGRDSACARSDPGRSTRPPTATRARRRRRKRERVRAAARYPVPACVGDM